MSRRTLVSRSLLALSALALASSLVYQVALHDKIERLEEVADPTLVSWVIGCRPDKTAPHVDREVLSVVVYLKTNDPDLDGIRAEVHYLEAPGEGEALVLNVRDCPAWSSRPGSQPLGGQDPPIRGIYQDSPPL